MSICAGTIMYITGVLLIQWTKNKIIDWVCNISGKIINNNYEHSDNWAIELRIIKKKKYILVKTILEIDANVSANTLYQQEKE